MMSDADDRELHRRLASGDESALTALYHRHRRLVYARAYLELRDRADAEEILHDTFLLMWNKRRAIRLVGSSTLPWLLTSARYLAANRRRRRMRETSIELIGDEVDREPGPAEASEMASLRALLNQCIAALSPADQKVIELCLIEGLSYKEAAFRLRTTHAAIRNRLSRARASLRLAIEFSPQGGKHEN